MIGGYRDRMKKVTECVGAIILILATVFVCWIVSHRYGLRARPVSRTTERYMLSIERLPQPTHSIRALTELIQKSKGLYEPDLADQVKWYLSRPLSSFDPDDLGYIPENIEQLLSQPGFIYSKDRQKLIASMIDNIVNEVEVDLPIEGSHGSVGMTIRGESWELLQNRHNVFKGIDTALYAKLHELACEEVNPHLTFLVLDLHRTRTNGVSRSNRHRDFLAYLMLYDQYGNWPCICDRIKGAIMTYPGEWDNKTGLEEILGIALDESGPEAYNLYHARYKSNFWADHGKVRDYLNVERQYSITSSYVGWPGEAVKGQILVTDVGSKDGVILINGVEKVIGVLRNGDDISSECRIVAERGVLLPVGYGKDNLFELTFTSNEGWWRKYEMNLTTYEESSVPCSFE